jgi:hypothetical protein
MAQRKPENRKPLDEVLKLVDELSSEEREELSRRLDGKSWGDRWRRLEQEIEQNRITKGLSSITEEEVYAEFREHRRKQKAEGAQARS